VIIATSVLELGIDVGDLDRVIQIDSPATVSSFLQRMGRTGRRPGTTRNCLFLATEDETLIQAAALVDLWSRGYVEPVQPPPAPYHIFAQQVMALVLQQRGIPRDEISRWLEGVSTFSEMSNERRDEILTWMLEHGILSLDGGVLSFGSEGEKLFGRKNFLEIFSVFLSPPLFSILHGRQELGFVDELTFLGKKEGPRVLLLGGRAWIVKHVDWQRKLAYVESTDAKGRSRWKGEGPGLGFEICQSVQAVLATEDERDYWSQRANERIAKVRSEYAWLGQGESVVVNGSDGLPEWWTFAGFAANAMLAGELSRLLQSQVQFDNFTLTFRASVSTDSISRAVTQLREMDPTSMQPVIDERAILSLKFAECLPPKIILECLMKRLMQVDAVRKLLEKRTSVVAISV
jgi:ATP-dependent Lhr-like helicase